MSGSGTRPIGQAMLVVLAIGIAVVAIYQFVPESELDGSLDAISSSDVIGRGSGEPLGTPELGRAVDTGPSKIGSESDAIDLGADSDGQAPAGPQLDDPRFGQPAGGGPAPRRDDRPEPRPGDDIRPEGLPDSRQSDGQPSVLRLVYFVEADREFDPEAVAAIEKQAELLQEYWFEQFGGTFRLPAGGVDVVYGDHPSTWYDVTPAGDDDRWNRLTNIRDEVGRKLRLTDGSNADRVLTYPDARIDGRVGANRYEGAWLDGDDISCVTGIVETTPYTVDYPAGCLATVAHELGHVYGLGHAGPDEDCMQFGFYHYASGEALCEFSTENRKLVQADPRNEGWLDAKPGDRL